MSRPQLPSFAFRPRRPIRSAPRALTRPSPVPLDIHARYRSPIRDGGRVFVNPVQPVLASTSPVVPTCAAPLPARLANAVPGIEPITLPATLGVTSLHAGQTPAGPASPPVVSPVSALPKATTGTVIQGIKIPLKPRAPGEEDCCMSGCVHCVYTIYAEELEQYTEAVGKARSALLAANIPESDWPVDMRTSNATNADGVDVGEKAKQEVAQNIDPTMAAFLALEGKLKQKRQQAD